MIITNVCLLLEALSIVICLHHLYGEKFRLDIATVSFLSIDMIIMTAINYFGLPKTYTMVIYPVIILYCGVRFGFEIKKIAVNFILCIILVGGLQLLIATPIGYLFNMHNVVKLNLLIMISTVFVVITIAIPYAKIEKLSSFLQYKDRALFLSMAICLVIISFWLIRYKKGAWMELDNTILLFLCIFFILVISIKMVKYKIKAKEMEAELKIHKLYSDSFQGLIDDIRLRQHEFDNHINAIYSQHFTYHTYEELVEAQRNYCGLIIKDNCFNRILSRDNPVIRGFLYGRFIEIAELGIEVSYQVVIKELDIGVPVYKLIEILGDLMNNAVEALLANDNERKMHVLLMETDKFFLEVRNESPYIPYNQLGVFFDKGYSKKGENRGLGLYNVKKICEEFGLILLPECKEINGKNWISFKISRENE